MSASSRARRRSARRARATRAFWLCATFAFMLLAGLGVTEIASGRWLIEPILSGSMRPGFPVGGVVAAQRVPTSSLAIGDVVLFRPPGLDGVMDVHRIIGLERSGREVTFRTKGDANSVPDPWTVRTTSPSMYEARFTLPLIGFAAVWTHSRAGRLVLASIGGSCGLGLGAWALRGDRRRRRHRVRPAKSRTRADLRDDDRAGQCPGTPTGRALSGA